MGTLAGKLRVALAEINYNRDANGNRIFDTTDMYEDGDDGWQKITRNAIKALKIYHTHRGKQQKKKEEEEEGHREFVKGKLAKRENLVKGDKYIYCMNNKYINPLQILNL
tara:strand:- start:958 stop:1287 length:330 start_codon:yes stop_codon:yes gene_type:complete